jgi:hypothetical protein
MMARRKSTWRKTLTPWPRMCFEQRYEGIKQAAQIAMHQHHKRRSTGSHLRDFAATLTSKCQAHRSARRREHRHPIPIAPPRRDRARQANEAGRGRSPTVEWRWNGCDASLDILLSKDALLPEARDAFGDMLGVVSDDGHHDGVAGLTDFGPGRSKLFGNSADAYLKVHHKGPTEADVTEGSGGIWERLHYDWSDPNRVVLTTTDSNLWGGASGHTYTFSRHPNGTTDIDVVSYATARTLGAGCSASWSARSARVFWKRHLRTPSKLSSSGTESNPASSIHPHEQRTMPPRINRRSNRQAGGPSPIPHLGSGSRA